MKPVPLLVRQFEVEDIDDARFWIELDVFYWPLTDITEIKLRGAEKAILTVDGFDVYDVHRERLGSLLTDVVPTTLDLHLSFTPEPHVEGSQVSMFCKTPESQFDFVVIVFKSIKNLKFE